MAQLKIYRDVLNGKILDKEDGEAVALIKGDWMASKLCIDNWFGAYKSWESVDTFNAAVADNRMTMRSFGSEFGFQVSKAKTVGITTGRFHDAQRKKLPFEETHQTAFKKMDLPLHKRGIDNSAYLEPSNFASRKMKYEQGLHDLSVRLMMPGQNVKASSHHMGETTPHYSFLPLSEGEDQYVLSRLMKIAKYAGAPPELGMLVRDIRSRMTRVKLSNDYDMGTGYTAVHTPGREDGLDYKVTYGLGNTIKKRGNQVPLVTGINQLKLRKEMYFKDRADIVKFAANEVVIAMRQHAGRFPVYAVYDNGSFKCFKITNGGMEYTGKTISANGVASRHAVSQVGVS